MRKIKKGSVDRSVDVYIIDSTDGTPETGVVFNTAGIDLNYRRDLSAVVAITEATLAALTTAHTDGGFLTIGFGTYRLDVPDAAWATGADHVTIFGTVTGMIVLPQTIQLVDYDPESAASLGLTNLDAAVSGRMATYTQPTGFLAATFPAGTVANTTNITAGTITTTTNLTNLPAITANWLTAAGTAADFGAELATAIWGDTTAGDFTVALSIGKSVMNGVALGTGLTINAYTGNTAQTGDSFARIGLAGAGLTNIDLPNQTMDITGNVSGSVGSVTAGVSIGVGGISSTSFAAGAIDAAAIATDAITSTELAASAAQEIADEVLNRDIAGGASGSSRNVRNALRAIRNKVSESGGTLTITQEDDTTAAWTATVTRTAGANPITTVDPV